MNVEIRIAKAKSKQIKQRYDFYLNFMIKFMEEDNKIKILRGSCEIYYCITKPKFVLKSEICIPMLLNVKY